MVSQIRSLHVSVIVTGASGQLGRLVIDQLLATVPAAEVTAVVRDPAKAGDLAAGGVTLAVADYNSPESFDGLLRAGDLSRLAGRPTTPVADTIAAALAG
jgi:uncharacterized protein YbjT (DUF2867 family)